MTLVNEGAAKFLVGCEADSVNQNGNVAVTGAAQPEENAVEPVVDEDQS